ASAATPQPRPDEPLYVTLQEDLTVNVGNETVDHVALRGALDQISGGDRDTRIFLRADKTVSYGDLMNVMNLLRVYGYTKIALVGLEGAPQPGALPAPQ